MNLGIFGGRIGRDADLRTTPGGDQVANFPLATDVGTRDNPKTLWIDCSLFGKRAESLQKFLVKGNKITATGRVTLDTFKGRDGVERSVLKLIVQEIDLHLPPKGSTGAAPADEGAPAKAPRPQPGGFDSMDDDVPF